MRAFLNLSLEIIFPPRRQGIARNLLPGRDLRLANGGARPHRPRAVEIVRWPFGRPTGRIARRRTRGDGPRLGREREWEDHPALDPRRIGCADAWLRDDRGPRD